MSKMTPNYEIVIITMYYLWKLGIVYPIHI